MDSQSNDFFSGFLARPTAKPKLAFQLTPKIKQEKQQESHRDREKSLVIFFIAKVSNLIFTQNSLYSHTQTN
jgi:hypothetical protein